MDLSRFGPSVNPYGPPAPNPLAAALAGGGAPGGPSSGSAMPSIPGLPPGIMPMPPAPNRPAIGGTGIPQISSAITPGATIAPLQGAPSPAMTPPVAGPVMPPQLAPTPPPAAGNPNAQQAPFGFGGLSYNPAIY